MIKKFNSISECIREMFGETKYISGSSVLNKKHDSIRGNIKKVLNKKYSQYIGYVFEYEDTYSKILS